MRSIIKILRLLRTDAGLTQSALAAQLNVTRDLIARIENNIQKITDDILNKYSHYFGIEISKLWQLAESFKNPIEYILRAHDTSELTPALQAHFEEWYDRMQLYSLQVPFLSVLQIPDRNSLSNATSAEEIADLLRKEWHLGNMPIYDPVALAEGLGFFITGTDLGNTHLFAITGRRGKNSQPGIMINTNPAITIERQRFSVIHEIGHLILQEEYFSSTPDYSGFGRDKEQFEKEIDAFAGAFLVPEDEFKRVYQMLKASTRDLPLMVLILKRHFKVSYQTIIYRLYDLHFIDDANRKRLFALFVSQFQKQEPLPLTEPLVFTQEEKIKALVSEKNLSTTDNPPATEVPQEGAATNPLQKYHALFGDYQVDLDELWEILQGKRNTSGEWDFQRLFKRLLEGLSWYELLEIFSVETIKTNLTDELIAGLYPPGRREYYAKIKRLLHGETVSTDGWNPANRAKTASTVLSNRWYRTEPTLLSA